MSKKYELTTETKKINGHTVYRIKALKSFKTIIGRRVNKGDLGGWVESENNLSQNWNCWLFDDAVGYENSRRSEDSVGYDRSRQFGDSRQYGYSRQFGDSRQFGNSCQYDHSRQSSNSLQFGHSRQFGNSRQFGHSWQFGDSRQYGDSMQYDDSRQYGNSVQSGNSCQYGHSRQYGESHHRTGDDDGTGKILPIGPWGDSLGVITIQPDNTIVAGCFHGNFDEFKRAIIEKYGKDYGSYSMCIKILDMSLKCRLEQTV